MEEKDWEAGIVDDMDRRYEGDGDNPLVYFPYNTVTFPYNTVTLTPSELQTVTAARQRASTEVKALVAIIDRLTTRQW